MIIRRPEGNLLEKRFTQVDWPADINYIEILPSVMSFDDNDIGVTGGQIFNIMDSLDFSNSVDGTVWFNFNYPKKWQIDRDCIINLYHSMDGVDVGTNVNLTMKIWIVNIGQSASELSPSSTTNVNVTTDLDTNIGKFYNYAIPMSNELILSKDCIVCGSITREAQSDNYTGLFKLSKILVRQI